MSRRLVAAALALALAWCGMPGRAAAQLRPLDPVDWRVFHAGAVVTGQLGGTILSGQRASIGGIRGRLIEAPAALLSWTTGRVALRAVIHPLRVFDVASAYAAPLPGTEYLDPNREVDAGDNAVETIVRLTGDAAPALAAVRWGVRLSTHNDKKGLDRHKVDFYALTGGQLQRGSWRFAGEAGIGVYGTRQPGTDKALPFLYSASVRRRLGVLQPVLGLDGQASRRRLRGNEDLAELKAGVRVGDARWLEATCIRGLAQHSPRVGFQVFAGFKLPR